MNSLLAYRMRTISETRTAAFYSTGIVEEKKNVPLIKALPVTAEI